MTAQEKAKDARLKLIYKSSLAEYNTKSIEQNDCCAICERPFKKGAGTKKWSKDAFGAFQDHFHGCCPRRLKKFCGLCNRGLLCYVCNKFVVGALEMKNIPVQRLADYIIKWEKILRQKGCYDKSDADTKAKEKAPACKAKKRV